MAELGETYNVWEGGGGGGGVSIRLLAPNGQLYLYIASSSTGFLGLRIEAGPAIAFSKAPETRKSKPKTEPNG